MEQISLKRFDFLRKRLIVCNIALRENLAQSHGASPAMWDLRWTRLALTPAREAGTRFTYPEG